MSNNNQKKVKGVFTVRDKGNGKSFWVKIGAAFECSDGSWNIELDALPTNGRLNVRELKEGQPE